MPGAAATVLPRSPREEAEGLEQLRALAAGMTIRVVPREGEAGRAVDTPAAQQRAVGGIHDCIDIERGDVGDDDVEDCLADLGGEPRHAPIISRACDFGCRLEIDRRAHTDVVVMCVEETARRTSPIGTQHLEEIVVGVEPAGSIERLS